MPDELEYCPESIQVTHSYQEVDVSRKQHSIARRSPSHIYH